MKKHSAPTRLLLSWDLGNVVKLLPCLENIKKRQVKAPKIYFCDSGIYHTLIDINDQTTLFHHPKLGASWEGFALEQMIREYQADPEECFYWGIHGGAELDLLIMKNGKRLGFECKYNDAPRLTNSMKLALEILKLDTLFVIYPGKKEYHLEDKVIAKGLSVNLLGA